MIFQGCFNCGKEGHKSFECPERKHRNDRNEERSHHHHSRYDNDVIITIKKIFFYKVLK